MRNKKQFETPSLTIEELTAELYMSKKELKKTNDLLIENEKQRTELFANLSHDLRSPMTALRSSVDYLLNLKEYSREELMPVLKLMQERILTLEKLVNNIFLLTVLENTAIPFNFENINIGMFLEDFFFNCEADSKYCSRRLVLAVPEDMDAVAAIDTVQFTRVLDNLFTNALKYSGDGASITLNASADDAYVYISVADTGIGMTEAERLKIFDRSYMAAPARTPGADTGCGLGLSIVKTIAERHGGTVNCESTPGKGSVFTVRLPRIRQTL